MQKIVTASTLPVGNNGFAVVAYLGNGKSVYHNGPEGYAYFTADQADRLAKRVANAGQIDPAHWYAAQYERDEYALLEAEYYEG
jgi:hypothetical protein